jgi:hypothetical protein
MITQYNALVQNVPAIPPLIPESTNFTTNYTDTLAAQSIRTTELTDGIVRLYGGRLTGLLNPVNSQDAANKSYADANITSYIPADPLNSVQFSASGPGTAVFGGSFNLLYNETNNSLYSKNIRIGNTSTGLLVGSGTIDNLDDPVNQQDPATKNYVDNFFLLNNITISNNVPTTYLASEMVGSIINRSGFTGTVGDTTASAGNIITEISGTTGSSVSFFLKNKTSSSTLYLSPGTGVTFSPTSTIVLLPGYQLSTVIVIDSISTVTIYITSQNYMYSSNNFIIGDRALNTTSNITRITDQFIFNTGSNILGNSNYNSQNSTYQASDVSGVIYRNYTGNKIDHFDNISTFINQILPVFGDIDYMFSSSGIEVIIKNISSSGSITIEPNGWILDPNSNMKIGPGQTGIFYLIIDVLTSIGNVYTLGVF